MADNAQGNSTNEADVAIRFNNASEAALVLSSGSRVKRDRDARKQAEDETGATSECKELPQGFRERMTMSRQRRRITMLTSQKSPLKRKYNSLCLAASFRRPF
jgi:hypothetical protein